MRLIRAFGMALGAASLARRLVLPAGGFVLLAGGLAHADTIRNPTAIFAGLDKITGRIISFDVAIDETVQFGTLQITPRICLTRPQTETPLTEGFIEVDEVDSTKSARRIFSGWMFAASPGLHGVEHPVYDIWLKDCKGGVQVTASPANAAPDANAPPPPNASPAPREGAAARKPRRTIEPQEPVEPSVENLPPMTPDAAPPPLGQPINPEDGLGAPIEVGPPPGVRPGRPSQAPGQAAQPDQDLGAPAGAGGQPGAAPAGEAKPPRQRRKPAPNPNIPPAGDARPVPPAAIPEQAAPQRQQNQQSGPQDLLQKIPFFH